MPWHIVCSELRMKQMTDEDRRPVAGILTGTAVGVAFWLIVLIVAGLLAAWLG
jgi:hypothetical protein